MHIKRTWSLLDEKLGTNALTMAISSGELCPPRETESSSAPSVLCSKIDRASTCVMCFFSTACRAADISNLNPFCFSGQKLPVCALLYMLAHAGGYHLQSYSRKICDMQRRRRKL